MSERIVHVHRSKLGQSLGRSVGSLGFFQGQDQDQDHVHHRGRNVMFEF